MKKLMMILALACSADFLERICDRFLPRVAKQAK
jgi:hypothetical protein